MKVEIKIEESTILSCVTELIMRGKVPTLKATKALIREMVTANGECFVVEPLFDDDRCQEPVVSWDEAHRQACEIAPRFYDKIY